MTACLERIRGWGQRVPAPVWWGGLLAYSGFIFFISSRRVPGSMHVDIAGFDKVLHAGAYAVWASLFLAASVRSWPVWPWRVRAAVAVAATAAYGLSDEVHQAFVPGRTTDVWDLIADAGGGVLAVVFWGLIRRRFSKSA